MTSWLCLLSTLLTAPTGADAGEALPPRLPFDGHIPVKAWLGPPAEATTLERYRELADCGFTQSFSGFPDADSQERALDIAHEAGIQLYVYCPELGTDPEATVARFEDHPAVAGWHLRDEPATPALPELAAWMQRIQAVDELAGRRPFGSRPIPGRNMHWCYINLFPTYVPLEPLGSPSYADHVETYLTTVPAEILSYDHYPIVGDQLRGDYYWNLEIIRNAARRHGIPFWAFTLAVAHNPYPIPTMGHLRLQVFSDLVYGAAGIQYFTYWTPVSDHWNFHEGPIRVDGTRSPVWDLAQAMNREIAGYAPVFADADVIGVGHTEPQPMGTVPYRPRSPVRNLTAGGKGAVVAHLVKADPDEPGGLWHFLAIVNRDFAGPMPLTVELEPGSYAQVGLDGVLEPLAEPRVATELSAGNLLVLTWREGTKPGA